MVRGVVWGKVVRGKGGGGTEWYGGWWGGKELRVPHGRGAACTPRVSLGEEGGWEGGEEGGRRRSGEEADEKEREQQSRVGSAEVNIKNVSSLAMQNKARPAKQNGHSHAKPGHQPRPL